MSGSRVGISAWLVVFDLLCKVGSILGTLVLGSALHPSNCT